MTPLAWIIIAIASPVWGVLGFIAIVWAIDTIVALSLRLLSWGITAVAQAIRWMLALWLVCTASVLPGRLGRRLRDAMRPEAKGPKLELDVLRGIK